MKLLLEHEDVDPDLADTDSRTPLSYAAGAGAESVVKLLLEHNGVNRNSLDVNGRSPRLLAAAGGYQGIVKLLPERNHYQLRSRNKKVY